MTLRLSSVSPDKSGLSVAETNINQFKNNNNNEKNYTLNDYARHTWLEQ